MTRALSVLAAVVILLGVGWFVGHRPVSGLKDRMAEQQARCESEKGELESRVAAAEARDRLWAAHAELLLASGDAASRNFGLATERVTRAHDLITRAAGAPGMILPLDPVRDLVDTAREALKQPEPDVSAVLDRAASELNRLLNRMGNA